MSKHDRLVENIKIAYIGGGSQGWARRLMSDLALEPRISGTVSLYDLNLKAAQTNEKIGNLMSRQKEATGRWDYKAVETIEEALSDSDFVIISILPGSLEEMARDVHLPEKYGIYQSVGDTVGPGGISRALRTIPLYVEIAERIKEHSPEAWVINYTNPMSLCTRTLYEVFPEIKAFGCCHEVFETQHLLADMVREMLDIEVVCRKDIKVSVSGINHFTWISKATYKQFDLMPLYKQFVEKYQDTGFEKEAGNWRNSVFNSCNRVKFDLFKKYGMIAAAGDRHLAEFMPPIYLSDPETVEKWKFHLTSVDFRKKDQEKKREENQKIFNGELDVTVEPSGEEGVDVLLALLGLEDLVTNVNIPNQGQIPNLPKGAIVETNALIRRDSVQPTLTDELPLDITNMVQRHVLNQEAVLQAALNKEKTLALNAFVNDPLVAAIPRNKAEALFEELVLSTKAFQLG
ncbi:alpha-glucosidase/alpha-galactosidase [Metabacillus herbersteinensis]|uniref:Alpha-glucosidase/alpha-galactosidase n=1 Tax=Metabacillus herbersteinensis TaxID=283816 RepID=A0ABV6G9N4_9BACI